MNRIPSGAAGTPSNSPRLSWNLSPTAGSSRNPLVMHATRHQQRCTGRLTELMRWTGRISRSRRD